MKVKGRHAPPQSPMETKGTLATSRMGARCLPGGGHRAAGPASLVLAWAVGTGQGGGCWERTLCSEVHPTPTSSSATLQQSLC